MKRTLLISTLVFALGFLSTALRAQPVFAVAWDTVNFPIPMQLNSGDTVTYVYEVRNVGNQDFSSTLFHNIRVNNGPVDTLATSQGDSLNVQGTPRQYSWSETTGHPRYSGGINVVVIWPSAPNTETQDTVKGTLQIGTLSMDDPLANEYKLLVFPNPFNASFQMQNAVPHKVVDRVRMHDLQGRLLREEAGLPREMDLTGAASGVYILEVHYKDGGLQRLKIVKD
ncbi:MAG: T9SS type A sorting domain-containing protein [Bacteroidota bacterium]